MSKNSNEEGSFLEGLGCFTIIVIVFFVCAYNVANFQADIKIAQEQEEQYLVKTITNKHEEVRGHGGTILTGPFGGGLLPKNMVDVHNVNRLLSFC